MSKQQAILETILGAAELHGKQMIASRIRRDIGDLGRTRHTGGYQRLWSAAFETKRSRTNAA